MQHFVSHVGFFVLVLMVTMEISLNQVSKIEKKKLRKDAGFPQHERSQKNI